MKLFAGGLGPSRQTPDPFSGTEALKHVYRPVWGNRKGVADNDLCLAVSEALC